MLLSGGRESQLHREIVDLMSRLMNKTKELKKVCCCVIDI